MFKLFKKKKKDEAIQESELSGHSEQSEESISPLAQESLDASVAPQHDIENPDILADYALVESEEFTEDSADDAADQLLELEEQVTDPELEAISISDAPHQETELETEQVEAVEPESKGLFAKLKQGLSKTSSQIGGGIGGIFTKRRLDDEMLDELEELLIMSDMGAANAATIVKNFSKGRFDKDIETQEVRSALAYEIEQMLEPSEKPLQVDKSHSPHVVMVVGVNGNGKTTTIGKIASKFKADGNKVMLAAADTFRAAAVEQLQVWAERADVEIVTGKHEADPASVAYSALEKAKQEQADVLLIDTAGRLQNKHNLMQELAKIVRVLQKLDADAPHDIVMVLDGTTGQNALSQVQTFKEFVEVTGCVVTKLDGTAKGGMVVALSQQEKLNIHFVGVGEQIDDLQVFNAHDFARSLTDAA